MLKGNKGEWSEIYTLFKIISDKKLFAGGADLNKIENLVFPIIKILRDESDGTYEYAIGSKLVIIKGNKEEYKILISEFHEKANLLLSELQKKTTSTFSIPEIEKFLISFNCSSLKAKSSDKSDIRIVIHDQRTSTNQKLGFSIKSQLGSASTLLNASQATNFVYRIDGVKLSDEQVSTINSINTRSKIKDRIAKIQEYSCTLTFIKTDSSVFGNNITLIDGNLPQILAQMLYLFFTTKLSKISDLVDKIAKDNPLGFNLESNHPFYSYKMKRFLSDTALGMMPSKTWTGELDATGGYLIVREDGEVLCYHIYERNEFEQYLFNNTKLETPSSTRHNFGHVYQVNNEQYFNLNLQIRFIK